MRLTNIEKETTISFNEHEKIAEIYTHNVKLINQIQKMCVENPEEYSMSNKNQYGGITCILPKKRLGIKLKFPPNPEVSKRASERSKKLKPWENSPKYQKRVIKSDKSVD